MRGSHLDTISMVVSTTENTETRPIKSWSFTISGISSTKVGSVALWSRTMSGDLWLTLSVDVPVQTSTPSTTTRSPESLKCAVNETIAECGRVCEPDCVSIFSRSDCDKCATPACACMQGYARNPQGVCVYWGDCPVNGRYKNLYSSFFTARCVFAFF